MYFTLRPTGVGFPSRTPHTDTDRGFVLVGPPFFLYRSILRYTAAAYNGRKKGKVTGDVLVMGFYSSTRRAFDAAINPMITAVVVIKVLKKGYSICLLMSHWSINILK